MSQLPDDAQASFHRVWARMNSRQNLPPGEQVPIPEPTSITYNIEWMWGGRPSLTPVLFMGMGNGTAISFLGNLWLEGGMRAKSGRSVAA